MSAPQETTPVSVKEATPKPLIKERRLSPEIDRKIDTWLEKVEKATTVLPKAVADDQTGQPLVRPATPPKPKITLPLTRHQIAAGVKKKVNTAIRWLSTWCIRLVKKYKGRVAFKKKADPQDDNNADS